MTATSCSVAPLGSVLEAGAIISETGEMAPPVPGLPASRRPPGAPPAPLAPPVPPLVPVSAPGVDPVAYALLWP